MRNHLCALTLSEGRLGTTGQLRELRRRVCVVVSMHPLGGVTVVSFGLDKSARRLKVQ